MIEKITDLADELMSIGYLDVYSEPYERMCSILRRSGAVSEDWQPALNVDSKSPVKSPKNDIESLKDHTGMQWEYKWSEDGEAHGPFGTEEMRAWQQQGFFQTASIHVRKLINGRPDGAFHALQDHELHEQ